ncbi:MAG: Crp/Fnr family transcriptional regulator [Pseudomonadota bacterium]
MALDDEIALFAQIPFFAGFETEHLRLLAFGAEKRRLRAGGHLFREGDLADGAYVVRQGGVATRHPQADSPEERIERTYRPGSIVEPMTLISLSKRPYDAVCTEDTEVLRISRALFVRMLSEYPHLAVMLRDRVGNELKGFIGKLDGVLDLLDDTEA